MCSKRFIRSDHLESHLAHKHKRTGPYVLSDYLIDSDTKHSDSSDYSEDESDEEPFESSAVIPDHEPFPSLITQPGYKGPLFTAPPKKLG